MIHQTRLAIVLTLFALLSALAASTPAAAADRWSRLGTVDPSIAAKVNSAYAQIQEQPDTHLGLIPPFCGGELTDPLVGTWRVTVTSPDFPPFQALHTYHADRTFTETSNLLATLTEGPAQGAWWGYAGERFLTFELFAFENGEPVGIIRVRNILDIDGPDHLTGYSTVDFIDPEGNVLTDIGTGTFEGTRIRPLFVAAP